MKPGLWAAAAVLVALSFATASKAAPPATCTLAGVGADSFCTIEGRRLHLVDWGGPGSPVILLTGLGNSARIYDELAPRLAKTHRVIALTRRGYGQSDGAQDYSNAALVGDILAVMDGLGVAKASFVGHSIAGGELSTLGADHPDRVLRLVYLDSAYDRTRALDITAAIPASAAPSATVLASLKAMTAWREATLESRSPAVGRDLAEIMALGPKGLAPRTSPATMLKIFQGDIAAPPRYAAIAAPALAIYSSKDTAEQVTPGTTPARRAEIAAAFTRQVRPWMLRAQADFIEKKACGVALELPRSTHMFYLRNPRGAAALITSYLAAPDPCGWSQTPNAPRGVW